MIARHKGLITLLLSLTLAAATARAGAGPSNFRPDMQIKKAAEPNYTGDGVYLPTLQSKSARLARGKMIAFGLRAENDGTILDDYYLKGCSSSKGFIVTYFHEGMNITTTMTGSVGHNTDGLESGDTFDLVMRIKVKKNADSGKKKICKVVAPSVSGPSEVRDAVVGKVTVK
ncbi:MAG: hypothetical protein WD276_00140 [Actinomycetota bacterium]